MRKENVFPTRRSIVPTLSVNATCVYLNIFFINTFYPRLKDKSLYCTYQKKGKKFYLLVTKKKTKGLSVFYKQGRNPGRVLTNAYRFAEMKSSDVPRYECIPVKTDLKGIDVYHLKPYAFDSVKSVEFFNFKVLK